MAGPSKHASWDTKKCKFFFFMEVTTYYWAQITSRNIMYFPNFTDSPLHGHFLSFVYKNMEALFFINDIYVACSSTETHGPLARYVKLRVAHAPGMPGMFFPPPRVIDPDMHHGTCITLGSLTSGFLWSRWREKFPGIPSACATRNYTYLIRGPWSN